MEWMSKVAPFDKGEAVWHFHPVVFLEALNSNKINITVDMLKIIFDAADSEKDGLLQEIAKQISENAERYHLDTSLRLSHFFAQVRQEISTSCKTIENDFTYSADSLQSLFRYFRIHSDEASLYGYTDVKYVSSENQIAIANRAYANKNGNGDVASGDGGLYRGRGLKHLTGRANYRSFREYHRNFWLDDVDFETNPELVSDNYIYVVRSGVYFWLSNNLYLEADKGDTDSVVNSITSVINSGTDEDSKRNRRNNFNMIFHTRKVFNEI
jgi:predicted chitinase